MTRGKSPHEVLVAQRAHLSNLLEAIQRCVYFLNASDAHLSWPLSGDVLTLHKKDASFFEALAAVNERFAKLQDTLGSAMRHSLMLSGEQADSFIRVLANVLHGLKADLWGVASRFVRYCAQELNVYPSSADFSSEFIAITGSGPA